MKLTKPEGNNGKTINTSKVIFWSVFVITLIFRLYKISIPITNNCPHAFRTSQTAIVVQDYFRNGFSFLHSSIPVFGAPWSVMFEFPTYQTVVYFLMKIFGSTNIDIFCRIVSLLFFYACTWAIMKLTKLFTDDTVAIVTGVLMLCMPYNIYWSRQALIDYLTAFLGITYIWCLYNWLDNSKRYVYYLAALVIGMLGFLTKAASMFSVVFYIAYFILEHEIKLCMAFQEESVSAKIKLYLKQNISRIIRLAVITLIPASMAVIWTRYIDVTKTTSKYTIWLMSENLGDWNYGPLKERFDLSCWNVILTRYLSLFGGVIVFLVTVILYSRTKKKYLKQLLVSFAAQLLTILVLFNLYYIHSYYLIVLIPFACYSWALMLIEIFNSIKESEKGKKAKLSVCISVLILSQLWFNFGNLYDVICSKSHNGNAGCYINTITGEDELIVISEEDWSPATLYNANRRGFMIQKDDVIDSEMRDFIKNDNYTTFVSHSAEYSDEFLREYDYVVQYPLELEKGYDEAEETYIYKFADKPIESRNPDLKLLNIGYAANGNTYAQIIVTDNNNCIHEFVTPLIMSKKSVSVDLSDISTDIKSIQMSVGGSDLITIEY